jgi:protein-S-isoprenylcysteine O-methyltransferase Ste14
MDYLLLAAGWILWCAVHSGLISITVTDFLRRRLGGCYRFHRVLYNLVAVAAIVPVVLYARSLQEHVLFRWEGFWVVFQVILLALAGFLFVAGARHYDMLQFFGLRQIMTGASHGVLSASGKLHTSGILGVTRHPWYLAAMMLIWAAYRDLTPATLITNVILTIYLVVGTILEERKLVLELGDEYREYRRQVSMLFPWKWLRSPGSPRY